MTEQNPIFIVGVGRSGTSLLQSILASNSNMSFLPETGFFRRYVTGRRLEKWATKSSIDRAVDRLLADPVLERLAMDVATIAKEAGQPLDISVYLKIQSLAMDVQGKKRFGDKDPKLIEWLPLLKFYFPKSYVIHIYRDPRGVSLSKQKADWSRRRGTYVNAIVSLAQLRLVSETGPKVFGKNFVEASYEDLVANPEHTLTSLCSQVGLTFEPAMLNFQSKAAELMSPTELQWKSATLELIQGSNAHKCEEELAPHDSLFIERCFRQFMNTRGYPLGANYIDLSLRQQLFLAVLVSSTLLFSRVYKHVLSAKNYAAVKIR